MVKRDETIDQLRGLAIFWVIVVHVLYWGNFFDNNYINTIKSFCLFEMPLFFFLTGASNSFSKIDGYFKFIFKRFKRILIPYWFFALICAGLSVAHLAIKEGMNVAIAIEVLVSWLIPVDSQITKISYLTWALWFVPVYLCVILIVPFLKRIKQCKNQVYFLSALLAIFVIMCIFDLGWIQNVVFYSFWTYIGLFYTDIILWLKNHKFRKFLGLVVLIGIVAIFIFAVMGQPIDMQDNKFPPNLMFGLFSIVAMSLIILGIPLIKKGYECICKYKLIRKIAHLFSTRSMTVFLYQAFAFNVTIRIANRLPFGNGDIMSFVKAAVCLITTVLFCAVLSLAFGKIEDFGVEGHK